MLKIVELKRISLLRSSLRATSILLGVLAISMIFGPVPLALFLSYSSLPRLMMLGLGLLILSALSFLVADQDPPNRKLAMAITVIHFGLVFTCFLALGSGRWLLPDPARGALYLIASIIGILSCFQLLGLKKSR